MESLTIGDWMREALRALSERGLVQTREYSEDGEKFSEYRIVFREGSIETNESSLFGDEGEANCIEEPKENPIKSSKKERANAPSASLSEREAKFAEECRGFTGEFGRKLVEEFILYWTEPNKSKTKMRFEQQTTWDTHRRLLTWKRNNFNKYEQYQVEMKPGISEEDINRLMNWRRDD